MWLCYGTESIFVKTFFCIVNVIFHNVYVYFLFAVFFSMILIRVAKRSCRFVLSMSLSKKRKEQRETIHIDNNNINYARTMSEGDKFCTQK